MPPEGSTRSKQQLTAKQRSDAEFRVGWKMAAISMEVASMVVAGALLGWGAQSIWGWRYSILLGALIGLAVGLWSLIKSALKLNRQLDALGPRPRPRARPRSLENPASESNEQAVETEDEGDETWRDEWDSWKSEDDADGDEATRGN